MQTLELCRWVYNEALAIRKNAWEQEGKSLSLYDTNKLLTVWKQEHLELKGVFSQVLQNVQARVDLVLKAFFRRVKAGEKPGFPRFRGKGRCDSFTVKQYGFELLENGLHLSKIGVVKIVLHHPLEGRIKTLTVQRDAADHWYACFACEVASEPLPFNELAVGVDVGLERLATLSDGVKVGNPRFFRRNEKALAKAQPKLSQAESRTPSERSDARQLPTSINALPISAGTSLIN
jgi:putative transposase